MLRRSLMKHHNPHIGGCCGNGGENCCGSYDHEEHIHPYDHVHIHA
ncbi:hypothetical protein [Terrisporobacter sp.]|nr:hypothetical protein [Terrisporobacter sp.]